MFSITTTESSIRRENASASPLSTMALIDLSALCRMKNVINTEIGMERKTATVARKLPRKIRIIRPVSKIPIPPSRNTVEMASFTNTDWSKVTKRMQLERECRAGL